MEDALIFAAGVGGSLLYLALLAKKTDDLGAGISGSGGPRSVGSAVGAGRFLVPVALVAGLALRNAAGAAHDGTEVVRRRCQTQGHSLEEESPGASAQGMT